MCHTTVSLPQAAFASASVLNVVGLLLGAVVEPVAAVLGIAGLPVLGMVLVVVLGVVVDGAVVALGAVVVLGAVGVAGLAGVEVWATARLAPSIVARTVAIVVRVTGCYSIV